MGLNFKSFILELFTIDVADRYIDDNEDLKRRFIVLLEKIIEKLGTPNLYDPANSGNEVSKLHTETDYHLIKDRTQRLLQAIYKDDFGELDLIFNNVIAEEISSSDFSHVISPPNKLLGYSGAKLNVECMAERTVRKKVYSAEYKGNSALKKGNMLYFKAVPSGVRLDEVKWLVANSGEEAISEDCLRGRELEESNNGRFQRKEGRQYKGMHFIQAIGYKSGSVVVISDRFWVKIK
jgi:hypothetical protein